MISVYDLGPSLTYQRRDALWLPAGSGWYGDNRDGVLTIRLIHSKRPKQEVDTYAVEKATDTPPGISAFLLSNLTDPEAAEVYQCMIHPEPELDRCSCTAGRVDHYRCKHRDSLRAVVEDGIL